MSKTVSFQSRSYGNTEYSEHKFKETTVAVPRCSRCRRMHERWKVWMEKAITYALIGLPPLALVGCGIAIFRGEAFWPRVGQGLLITVGGVFWFAGVGAALGWLWPTGGVRRPSYGKRHPSVLKLMEHDWVPSAEQDYYGTNTTREWGRTRVED